METGKAHQNHRLITGAADIAATLSLVKGYNVAPHPALDRYHTTQGAHLEIRERLLVRKELVPVLDSAGEKTGETFEREIWLENVTVYLNDQGEIEFYFDPAEAQRWIDFIEKYCTHAKAKWAKQPLLLEAWQKWIIREFFGWRRIGTALRRYKYLFLFLPRKNGKSLLIAALALGFLLIDGEMTPEIYATASTDEQAGKLFEMAKAMVNQNPELNSRLEALKGNISCAANGGYFRPIPFNPDGFHGANPSAVILDEYHVQKTTGMKRVGETGMGARDQPAVLIITTAGDRRNTPCEIELNYALSIRDGALVRPNYLPCIFRAEESEDWKLIETAINCNPNYPLSPSRAFLLDELEKALTDPKIELEYRQLQLNQFIEKRTIWLDYSIWTKGKTVFDFRQFRGEKIYWGLDLGSTDDLTALVLVKPGGENSGDWFLHAHFWCPADTIKIKALSHSYLIWSRQGYLVETPGAATDYGFIKRQLLAYDKYFNLTKGYADRANATWLIQQLRDEEGIEVDFMGQGLLSMTEPIKFMSVLAKHERLKHNNPVLDWMSSNTIGDVSQLAVKFDKSDDTVKIDGMVAAAMGVNAALGDLKAGPDYSDGLVIL